MPTSSVYFAHHVRITRSYAMLTKRSQGHRCISQRLTTPSRQRYGARTFSASTQPCHKFNSYIHAMLVRNAFTLSSCEANVRDGYALVSRL